MATIDTKFFGRSQHGGMVIIADKSVFTGNIFWVDSAESAGGDTDGHGQNPGTPFLTIDYAIGRCTASNGDVIYVAPGHAETLTGAGGITMDVAGVSIIGLGSGDTRPTITFTTAAAASVLVSASDCVIANMRFICNITVQNHMIDVAADDLEIYGCSFKEGTATGLCFISADTTDGDSDNLYVHDCDFYAPTAGNYDQAIDLGKDHVGVRIINNKIYGDFDEACIDAPADGNACLNLQIKNNELSNLLTGQHAIQLNGTTGTGMIAHNMCQTDTQAATIDGSACSCFDNWWSDVDGSNDEEAVPVNSYIAGTIAAGNDAVPTKDTTDDVLIRDVVGKKDDVAAETVATTKSIVAIGKGTIGILGVPAKDTTDDVHISDVVGKKDDVAAETVADTKSLVAIGKGVIGILGVPAADTTDDAHISDVVGKKDDAAAETVAATKSLVGIGKGIIGILGVPVKDTTTDVHISDVVGKKDDIAAETVADTKSLVGIGKGIIGILGVPAKDTTDDVHISDVVGKKDDAAAAGPVTTEESLVAYTKQSVEAGISLITLHGVPAKDTTDDVNISDVVGKKDDVAAETVAGTKSLVAIGKGAIGILGVPAKDTTDDVHISDVVGKKDDIAAETVADTKSLVGIGKGVIGILGVPTKDTTDDVHISDVVGKKDDIAAETVADTKSLVGIGKGIIGILGVPAKDTTDDAHISDVVGKKEDDAQETVGTTRSLVGIAKGINTILAVPTKDTTDDVHISDVVGKKDDVAAETVADTKSLVGIGKGIIGILGVPTADTTDNVHVSDVVGNKTDAAASGIASATESLMAYTKQGVTNGRHLVTHEVTFTALGDGAVGSHALFTVTGAVRCRVMAFCTTNVEIQAGATLEAGIVGATTTFMALTAGDAIDVGNIWHDATPDASIELDSVYTWRLLNGTDITYDVKTDTLDSGVIDFVVEWEAITATGNVVAA